MEWSHDTFKLRVHTWMEFFCTGDIFYVSFRFLSFHILSCWFAKPIYRYSIKLYCTATSRILCKMTLMAPPLFIFFLLINHVLVQKSSARWRSLSYLILSSLILSYLILRWRSCTKNYQWGVQFICPSRKWIRGGCLHNLGDLKGV